MLVIIVFIVAINQDSRDRGLAIRCLSFCNLPIILLASSIAFILVSSGIFSWSISSPDVESLSVSVSFREDSVVDVIGMVVEGSALLDWDSIVTVAESSAFGSILEDSDDGGIVGVIFGRFVGRVLIGSRIVVLLQLEAYCCGTCWVTIVWCIVLSLCLLTSVHLRFDDALSFNVSAHNSFIYNNHFDVVEF